MKDYQCHLSARKAGPRALNLTALYLSASCHAGRPRPSHHQEQPAGRQAVQAREAKSKSLHSRLRAEDGTTAFFFVSFLKRCFLASCEHSLSDLPSPAMLCPRALPSHFRSFFSLGLFIFKPFKLFALIKTKIILFETTL